MAELPHLEDLSKAPELLEMILTQEGRLIHANEGFLGLIETELEETKGEYVWDISLWRDPEQTRKRVKESIDKAKKGRGARIQLDHNSSAEEKVTADFVLRPVPTGDVEPRFLLIGRDITQLQQVGQSYKTIFETTGTGMIILEEDNTIALVNREAEKLSGYSKEEIEGKLSWTQMVAEKEDLEKMKEYHRLRREDPELAPDQYEFTMVDKEGEEKVVLLTIDLIPGTKRSVASLTDITTRKEIERKLTRYKAGVEASDDSVYMIDKDFRYLFANREHLARLTEDGKIPRPSRKRVIGAKYGEIHAEEEAASLRSRLARIRETGETEQETYQFLTEDRWSQRTYSPVGKDGKGEFEGLMVISKDITKRKKAEKRLRESEQRLRQSFIQLAETISRVLGVRDPYTQKHEQRVADLAREVGRRMELEEEQLLGLYLGGILHDIGKIAIPETILTKPGELKGAEWDLIKSHPEVGHEQILEDTDFPWPVAEMVLHHHERLDGSGYPHGLEGDQLSTEVRVLGPVDVVEAMSSRRPYREVRSKEETLEEILEGKGSKYDPEVVEILVKMIEEGEVRFGETNGDYR